MPHVLVVDDEEDLCELIKLRLSYYGFRVTARQTLRGALDVLASERVDCIVLDLRLDNENGLELLARAGDRTFNPSTVVLTADGASQVAIEALRRGVYTVLTKPFDTQELVSVVTRVSCF